jgi:phage tail sheath protein FI
MAVKVSYPGVYIEEFAPGGPIQQAGTNTAALLGPLARGPLVYEDTVEIRSPVQTPLKITSKDQFFAVFGERPAPGFFTWYAVRGFFVNGGSTCYVVRVSNARYAQTDLLNDDGLKLATVYAYDPGAIATPILFEVTPPARKLLPDGTKLYAAKVQGSINGSRVSITAVPGDGAPADARCFRVGDKVQVSQGGVNMGRLARVRAATPTELTLDERYDKADGVDVELVYDSVGDVRVVSPTPDVPLPAGALDRGSTLRLNVPGGEAERVVDVVESSRVEQVTGAFRTYRLTLRNGLTNKITPSADEVTVETVTFDVNISQGGTPYPFVNLAPDPTHDQYYVNVINDYPGLVRLVAEEVPPPVRRLDELRPADGAVSVQDHGSDESLTDLVDNDFINALELLKRLPDVRLVSVPDGYDHEGVKPTISPAVQSAMIAHCEQMGDRFAVLDPMRNRALFGDKSIELQRNAVDSARGYAALYYPWVWVNPAGNGPNVLVPPSGHVCGLMARVDDEQGVFKAPANEILRGTVGVERTMSEAEHGLLNLQNINVIRVFKPNAAPVVYGARTTATDSNWNYVNVRRLFLYLESSIQEGIRWAVFQPSNLSLWRKLEQSIGACLLTQWRDGALFGATPKDAFYVRIDEALNPASEQTQGRLNIEIGVRPTYPAEFIIVRIGIWFGGSEVTEG